MVIVQYSDIFFFVSKTVICLNKGEPPSKPKYVFKTNSEQVPWGKGEKNPKKGSEKEPETKNFQSVEAFFKKVTAYLLHNGSASKWKKQA